MLRVPREESVVEDVPHSQLRLLSRTTAEYVALLTEEKRVLPTSASRYEVRRPAVLDLLELVVGGSEEVAASKIGIPSPGEGYSGYRGPVEGGRLFGEADSPPLSAEIVTYLRELRESPTCSAAGGSQGNRRERVLEGRPHSGAPSGRQRVESVPSASSPLEPSEPDLAGRHRVGRRQSRGVHSW